MKIRFRKLLLVPLALGLLTTSCKDNAQQNSRKSGGEEKVVKATPEQRAAALGSLALVPAGSSLVFSLYDLNGIVRDARGTHVAQAIEAMNNNGKSGDQIESESVSVEVEVDPSELMAGETKEVTVAKDESQPALPEGVADIDVPVKDVVIALGDNQPQFLESMLPLLEGFYYMNSASTLLTVGQLYLKEGEAKTDFSAKMKEFMDKILSDNMAKSLASLDLSPGKGSAPFMAIATLTPEAKAQAQQGIDSMIGMAPMLCQGMAAPYSLKSGGIDFKGLVVDGKIYSVAFDQLLATQKDEALKAALNKTKEKLQNSKLYVLTAFRGDQLIAIICTNPEQQVRLAATPAQSVLSQEAFSFVDAHLKSKIAGLVYMSPEMNKAVSVFSKSSNQASLKGYSEAVRLVGVPYGASSTAVETICSAFARLNANYGKLIDMNDISEPTTAIAWRENGVKVTLSSGMSSGLEANPQKDLSVVNQNSLPDAALVGHFSLKPELIELYSSMFKDSIIAAWEAAGAFNASPNAQKSLQFGMYYSMLKSFESDIAATWKSAELYVSSMSGSRAVAIRLNEAASQGKADHQVNIPSFAFADGLRDRKKLDEVWTSFLKTVSGVASKMGVASPLEGKIASGKDGDAVWYTMEGFKAYSVEPTVVLNNSLLVCGSSPDWSKSVYKAASASDGGNSSIAALHVKIPAWVHFANGIIQKNSEGKGDDAVRVLKALSADLKSIDYSATKDGNKLIQKIEFNAVP